MGKLYRPYIPLSVRVRVAERQFTEAEPRMVGYAGGHTLKSRLAFLLSWLATRIGCKVTDLRLDHDPPLGAREKVFKRGVHVDYIPAANDPDSLRYRPHGPEFEGSHLIKTNHAGDHGQHPDRVLIKKQRRLENPGRAKKPSRFSTSRKIAKPVPSSKSRTRETSPTSSGSPKTPSRDKFDAPFAVKRPWPKRRFPRRSKR